MRYVMGSACVWLALAGVAAGQTLDAERLTVGGSMARPDGTSVRLDGLGTSGGTLVLLTDTDGDVFERVLGKSDLPAVTGYTDATQTWGLLQTFTSGLTSNGLLTIGGANDLLLGTGGVRVPSGSINLRNIADSANIATFGDSAIALVQPVTHSALATFTGNVRATASPYAIRNSGNSATILSVTDAGRVSWLEHLYPSSGYTSDLAQPSAKMRSLHAAELFIETIVAQERITTMGGRLTVTPSNVLTRDIDGTTTTVCVKYNSFMLHVGGVEYGSKLMLEKAGQFEAMYVNSTTVPTVDPTYGDYCYDVLRNVDVSGANAWTAGDGIIDTGKTGSGMIDQFAVRGLTSASIEGPSIDFLVRTGDAWNALAHRGSVGNLNGRYGYAADIFGAAFGDSTAAWMAIDATNGLRWMTSTTPRVTLAPAGELTFFGTDGVRTLVLTGTTIELGRPVAGNPVLTLTSSTLAFCSYGGACKLSFDGASGDITTTGSIQIGIAGHIRGGATSTTAGTGVFLGYESAAYKFRIGAAPGSGSYLLWNGSTLDVRADAVNVGGTLALAAGDLWQTSGSLTIRTTGATTFVDLSAPLGVRITGGVTAMTDGSGSVGSATKRFANIHLALPNDTAPGYVVVGNSSVDGTRLAYLVGFTGTKTIRDAAGTGTCTLIYVTGILTGGTC